MIFLKNKSIITVFIAAAVLLLTAFGSHVKFSGVTYDSAQKLPERSAYVLKSSGGDKFNINTISENMLKTLPRVGKYAKEICALRDELGGFTSLEELSLINGIGPETVDYAAEILKIK